MENQSHILQEELKLGLLRNEQLRKEAANRIQEVAQCCSRFNEATKRSMCLGKQLIIQFPVRPFTIRELEAANSTLRPADVRVELAAEISVGHVEFLQSGSKNAAPADGEIPPFMYRIAPSFHPLRHAA